ALRECAVAAQVNLAQAYLTTGEEPARQGNAHLQIVPYQLFATADGWLVLAVGNDGQWQQFCKAANRPDLASDPRFATNSQRVEQRNVLLPLVADVPSTRTTAAWEEALLAAGVPHAPVWGYEELFAHPQAQARGLRVTVRDPEGKPVELVGSPFEINGTTLPAALMPPSLGRDTASVLEELLGLSATRLEELRGRGVI